MNPSELTHGVTVGRSYTGGMMAKGKTGEAIVLGWLQRRPDVLEMEDLRDLRPMRKADADAIVFTRDGLNAFVEIKLDNNLGRTGNVLFEIMRVNHGAAPERACTLGWSMRSPATWLLYYAPANRQLFVFRFSTFRQVFQRWTDRQRRVLEKNGNAPNMAGHMRWINTDADKSTLTVLVPLKEFPSNSYGVYELGEEERATADTPF